MDKASRDVIDYAAVQKNRVKIETVEGYHFTSRISKDGNNLKLEDAKIEISMGRIKWARHANVGHH